MFYGNSSETDQVKNEKTVPLLKKCVQLDCAFFCIILPDAFTCVLGIVGSWSGLGRKCTLGCLAFLYLPAALVAYFIESFLTYNLYPQTCTKQVIH